MSFRVSAVVATVVLGIGSVAPVSAQPVAPVRPRSGAFGNIFTPGQQLNGGLGGFGQNQPFINPIGPQIVGGGNVGQFAVPGQGYPGQVAYPLSPYGSGYGNPQLPPSGIVGTFNSSGSRSGYYGHWYPNGVANGRGALGFNGGGGYAGVGPVIGGGYQNRPGGSLAGTALGVGATVGALRR